MRVGIVGSRDFDTATNEVSKGGRTFIAIIVRHLIEGDYVVSGGAGGADTWAEYYATGAGISRIIHIPQWKKYGRAAGPKRNSLIVNDSDAIFAFYTDVSKSKGTRNCVDQARASGKPVFEFDSKMLHENGLVPEWMTGISNTLDLLRSGRT